MKKAVLPKVLPAAIGPYSHGVAIGDLFLLLGRLRLFRKPVNW